MANYEVIVGNIGKVYEGGFYQSALDEFKVYEGRSIAGDGKAAGEPVTLLKDGEIMREYAPQHDEECPECGEEHAEGDPCIWQESDEEPTGAERINTDLLEALRALTDWGREFTSPRDANNPMDLLIRAMAVIEKADALKMTKRIDSPLQDWIVEAIATHYETTPEAVANDIANTQFAQEELDSFCESMKGAGY